MTSGRAGVQAPCHHLESDEFDEYNYFSQGLCHSCLLVFKTQLLKLWLRKLYGTRSLSGRVIEIWQLTQHSTIVNLVVFAHIASCDFAAALQGNTLNTLHSCFTPLCYTTHYPWTRPEVPQFRVKTIVCYTSVFLLSTKTFLFLQKNNVLIMETKIFDICLL